MSRPRQSGPTASRPTCPVVGERYFDTTVGGSVEWDGSAWVELGGGGGAETFLDLTDTPSSYASQAGKVVAVNGTPDALEFVAQGSGGGLDADLLDGQHASAFAASSHTHDDRYYTEAETDTLLAGKADSSHTHAAADVTSGTLDGDRLPAMSSTKKGGVPATGTPTNKFLRDDGTWQTAGGSTTFTGLTDTPSSYSGQAGKIVAVNSTPDALVFVAQGSGGGLDADLLDGQHASAFAPVVPQDWPVPLWTYGQDSFANGSDNTFQRGFPASLPGVVRLFCQGDPNATRTAGVLVEAVVPDGFNSSSHVLKVRVRARYVTASNTSDTISALVYLNGAGSNLSTSGAQNLGSALAYFDVELNEASLSAGDHLVIYLRITQNNTGGMGTPEAELTHCLLHME